MPPQGKYNAAQRISYTAVLVMALIIVVSGFAIYKPTQLYPLPLLFGGYQGARLVHFWMTIGLRLFFLVHVLQVVRSGWGNFRSMVTGYVIERRVARHRSRASRSRRVTEMEPRPMSEHDTNSPANNSSAPSSTTHRPSRCRSSSAARGVRSSLAPPVPAPPSLGWHWLQDQPDRRRHP